MAVFTENLRVIIRNPELTLGSSIQVHECKELLRLWSLFTGRNLLGLELLVNDLRAKNRGISGEEWGRIYAAEAALAVPSPEPQDKVPFVLNPKPGFGFLDFPP